MMHAILFILYFLLCCLAIARMRFFRGEIKPAWLIVFFSLHVTAGCVHTWVAYQFYPNHGDIWYYFTESINYKRQLLDHPGKFISHTFSSSLFNITDPNLPLLDIQYQALQYLNAFLNIFSFDNFYINTLLFSFPVFAGTVALFKVFYVKYNKALPAFCTILLPSVLFWTSVIHKDSIFFMAIGFFLYCLSRPVKPVWRKGTLLFCCAIVMFFSRANALITFLPAILFFIFTDKKIFSKKISFAFITASIVVLTIAVNLLSHGTLLQKISEKQKDFQSLNGGSRIYLPLLEPTTKSVLSVLPVAIVNGLFQPLPGQGGQAIYAAFSAELLLVWLVILYACWLMLIKKQLRFSNFDLTCLLFSLPGLIIIGYLIPFVGAIIRYRSIYFPFLMAPFINILCSYPVAFAHAINQWLEKHVMIEKTGVIS